MMAVFFLLVLTDLKFSGHLKGLVDQIAVVSAEVSEEGSLGGLIKLFHEDKFIRILMSLLCVRFSAVYC